jgi:hypothetical protein
MAPVRRAALGARWLSRLGVAARTHDIVHVHSATTVGHSRYAAPRYVLHCHGTDVRTTQYDPDLGPRVRGALANAEAVLYSTPDLAEHVHPRRPEATYLPVPVSVGALPHWNPDRERPRVVFASRWDQVKGLDTQVRTALGLVHALAGRAEVVGLDWGPAASAARDAGVRLVPRMDHETYLAWLAGSSAIVGQAAGILSSSELEAMGTGAPLLMPVPLPLYAGLTATPPPVLGQDVESVVDAAVASLDHPDGQLASASRDWVTREHGVDAGLDRILAVHARVLAHRERPR